MITCVKCNQLAVYRPVNADYVTCFVCGKRYYDSFPDVVMPAGITKAEVEARQVVCVVCGQPFTTSAPNTKACPPCRPEHKRQVEKALRIRAREIREAGRRAQCSP